ncbi:MAG TPA: cupin domain-containing protein [Bacteroidales bacterium]|nr:cupin domain-containing protein [Bacteroidales bacterium]HPT01866.1 cupin domain-containing protein [Bacteroidales bacterium]
MKINAYHSVPAMSSGHDARVMHSSPGLEVVHLHLLPGEAVAQHVNNIDIVMCLLQGNTTIVSGDHTYNLNPFDVIEIPAGVERGVVNSDDGDARILVLKKIQQHLPAR